MASFLSLSLFFCFLFSDISSAINGAHRTARFEFQEATIDQIRTAFDRQELTSREVVEYYLGAIRELNPRLRAVIEVNPDALALADQADEERRLRPDRARSPLHGIPVLLKDSLATKDRLNTTAGSFALLGSVVRTDAGVVTRLRRCGAIILGKAALTEWGHFRSFPTPNGWSARGGQAMNPYVATADPCGSSTGSATGVAANLAPVSLGTETDGSIICPASANSVVGIKPTVGLTSRAGMIPVSPRQDTIGPFSRTVADSVYLLDEIVGYDPRDSIATREAAKFIPVGGYKQFLKKDGLHGKRLGIVRQPFFNFSSEPSLAKIFQDHIDTMRRYGAVIIDNLEIPNISTVLNYNISGELLALAYEFRESINSYLADLESSPIRSLADAIAFNSQHPVLEKLEEYGQEIFLFAENTSNSGEQAKMAVKALNELSRNGYEKMMQDNHLDAMVTPGVSFSAASVLAIGGYPEISVPAGYYGKDGAPVGICFSGLRFSEPALIEIAYSFEQATKIRRAPKVHV
ncbi:probable amidase At4g34880 [Nymphaea colorata]|nr:probable amidase At4g34880 [Nymphaea colorata]